MKKWIVFSVFLLLAATLVIGTTAEVSSCGPASCRPPRTQTLNLYEKTPNPTPTPWTIVPGGAWGRMTFKKNGGPAADSFTFTGCKLVPGRIYGLIYYPDPWPGTGLKVLGISVADSGGHVNIAGDFDFDSIPIPGDLNAVLGTSTIPGQTGAKIWLVWYSDITFTDDGNPANDQFIAWNPGEYLFEGRLI